MRQAALFSLSALVRDDEVAPAPYGGNIYFTCPGGQVTRLDNKNRAWYWRAKDAGGTRDTYGAAKRALLSYLETGGR